MSKTKGILLTMLAASSFGFIPLFAVTAYADGFNPYTFSLFRSAFASLEIFIFIKIMKINLKVKTEQYFTLFKASLIGYCFMMLTLFMSYNYMATGLATTLHFIYPVAVMIGSIVFFKEKVSWKKIFALLISMVGIFFLMGFGSFESISVIGAALALVSGLFYAYYVLTVAYGNIKNLNSFVLAFYISLFNTFVLLFGSLVSGNFHTSYGVKGLISTVLVALVCNLIGMVAFQAGLKVISATAATIFSTFEPVTSLIIGVLVLSEILSWYHVTGSLLIIISVVIAAFAEKNSSEEETLEKQTVKKDRKHFYKNQKSLKDEEKCDYCGNEAVIEIYRDDKVHRLCIKCYTEQVKN
jgi:drug/metabolite transporter (DMT)-like permease